MAEIKMVKVNVSPTVELNVEETRAFMDLLNWTNECSDVITSDERSGAQLESYLLLNQVWNEVDNALIAEIGYGEEHDEYYFDE